MAEWRWWRGWTEEELEDRLRRLSSARRNFPGTDGADASDGRWDSHGSRSVVGHEAPGPVVGDGDFCRARAALANYAFSDPTIVEAHFRPEHPLRGRRMLLELKPLKILHFLVGVVIAEVRDEPGEERPLFGFRYDTLEGHVERGSEWFLLEKDRDSGEITMRIEATWAPGDFPNLWSRIGFALLVNRYQRRWHRQAHRRMARLASGSEPAHAVRGRRMSHQGPEVTFTRGGET